MLNYFILLQTFWKLNVCITIQFAALWWYISFECIMHGRWTRHIKYLDRAIWILLYVAKRSCWKVILDCHIAWDNIPWANLCKICLSCTYLSFMIILFILRCRKRLFDYILEPVKNDLILHKWFKIMWNLTFLKNLYCLLSGNFISLFLICRFLSNFLYWLCMLILPMHRWLQLSP